MTVRSWEEHRENLEKASPRMSETFDLPSHPQSLERSTFDRRICYCQECRNKIDSDFRESWLPEMID